MVNSTNDNSRYDVSSGYSPELKELLEIMLITDQKSFVNIRDDMYKTFTDRVCQEISAKLESISNRTKGYPHSRPVIEHVIERMRQFICDKHDQQELEVWRIPYQLEIAHKLERIDWDDHSINVFTPVDEVLIYMNYNSKTYIDMLQGWLTKRIEAPESPFEQLKLLNFYTKGFSQLLRKPDIVLHRDYLSLWEVIEQWFEHESKYLQAEYELRSKAGDIAELVPQERVKWSLSADQLALMIRAADDVRMFAEKSMNTAFKKLVPHFSSIQRDVLSPSAVRSRAYHAEESDKQLVIGMLEKMIKRIKDY